MNTNERVLLKVNNLNDLAVVRPRSSILYNRLIQKINMGESVTISLSKQDLRKRQEDNKILPERGDSDAGLASDL